MLVIYKASLVRRKEIKRLIKEEESYAAAEEMVLIYFELVRMMAQKFMGLTNYMKKSTLMDYVLRIKAYTA